METVLNVEPRTPDGKGGARKLRAQGKIPGVVYGHKQTALSFAVDPKIVQRTLSQSGYGKNTVVTLKGLEREPKVLLKDAQLDPIKKHLLHLDFMEVKEDDEVIVPIPVETKGRAEGVVKGGLLQKVRREIKVACKPSQIVPKFVLDVTSLDLGDTIHAEDIPLAEGMTLRMPGNLAIITVAASRAAKEVDTATAEAGAEGAPAEGAAAPAAEKKD